MATVTTNKSREQRIKLLLCRYVKNVELSLDNKIIPDSIILLCFSFYFISSRHIILLSENFKNNSNGFYIADLNDNRNPINPYNCNVYDLNNNKLLLEVNSKGFIDQNKDWIILNSAICNVSNMKIPNYIHTKIKNNLNINISNISNDYNVTFKCLGNRKGFSSSCSAILINNNSFHNYNQSLNAYYWRLSTYPKELDYASAIHSSKHNALYIIGGWQSKEVYKLSFDEYNDTHKWNRITEMNQQRAYPSVCMIDNDINSSKMIVIGGYDITWEKTVEIYDFDKNEWKYLASLNAEQSDAGCVYDKHLNYVYNGGGEKWKGQMVEYLDIVKNVWITLPLTNGEHRYKPVMWMNDVNNVCIASAKAECIECLDMREKAKQWKYISATNSSAADCVSSLSDLFGTKIPQSNDCRVTMCSSM